MITLRGWHFLPADRRLANGDGRKVVVGQRLEVSGPVVLCSRGLHASERPIDALANYMTDGGWICRVEVDGQISRGIDKFAGQRRRCLWMAPADLILLEWTCRIATRALEQHYPDAPTDLWHAIDLRLASMAGLDVDAGARVAAGAAAWDAAWDAAWGAAGDVARAAAWAAAWDAAWGAAWDAQNAELERMLHAAGAP